jgi:hypothetical protein
MPRITRIPFSYYESGFLLLQTGQILCTEWLLMSGRVITGIVAFCIAGTGVFVGNMLTMMMIGEINRKRREDDLVSYFGFTPGKARMIVREYRRLYQDGKLHIYSYLIVVAVIAAMMTVAVCARIIG